MKNLNNTLLHFSRRALSLALIAFLLQAPQLLAQASSIATAQAAPMALHIVILDGENALNNIRQRTAREPIVQVEDENHKPVAGALVLFAIRPGKNGAGGTFAGATTLSVVTGLDGQAIAAGLLPNTIKGTYTISVQATVGTLTTAAIITQSNILGPASSTSQSQGSPGSTPVHHFAFLTNHVWIVAGVTAATAAIVTTVVLTSNNGATITAGQGTVKP